MRFRQITVTCWLLLLLLLGSSLAGCTPYSQCPWFEYYTEMLDHVTFGDEGFVAIDRAGGVLTSADGHTWTFARDLRAPVHSLAYGNDVYIAGGNCGKVAFSPDGRTWKWVSLEDSPIFLGPDFVNGAFMASGVGQMLRSEDGLHWVRVADHEGFRMATYGEGRYVAVGGHAIQASEDGESWRKVMSVRHNGFTSVHYASGQFVAVGAVGGHIDVPATGFILTSPDGITWTEQTVPVATWLKDVTFADAIWVAVGTEGTILVSSDGVEWEVIRHLPMRPSDRNTEIDMETCLNAVAYGGGRFVAVGCSRTILHSEDGRHWEQITVPRR